ncbi:hypothetical protein [Brumimicrobium oceani]|uniref:Uncharacterized protein n=1 Tax=Brumimicrobium oceani TaxID=2100725 RepID=A0A2U2XED3_9FLAO|nr:hypothetical protein [Brumimicrobium oceani]PWH86107.1 hypothetical protein DIT68_06010 [Brumimicrobium oceani]
MKDTQTITFSEDMFDKHSNCFDGWSESYALLIINEALKELKYEGIIDDIAISKYACREIIEGKNRTEVCYAETDIGYFYLIRDMVDHINVVYNRWD